LHAGDHRERFSDRVIMTTSHSETSSVTAAATAGGSAYDAILVVGFGGPEGRDEVMPFLENVTRGRNVPRERLLEVAEHYYHFDGISPINGQVRELIAALRTELDLHGIHLPIYWGNRNWAPMLADTMAEMKAARVRRALGLVLSGYSSYSSCRQYREDVARACEAVGPGAAEVGKIRVFYNHPLFIEANADRVRAAVKALTGGELEGLSIVFTAHSIPGSMAASSRYEEQLREASRLVAEAEEIGADQWSLVYQSRSGRPQDPWLEPDVLDHLKDLHARGVRNVVVHPIGFLSDHMEVMYDLDEEARHLCGELGMRMARSETVGLHPAFVSMLRELIEERIAEGEGSVKRAIGQFGPSHDVCPENCCSPPARPGGRPSAS
jgi:ferrochelatase